MSARTKKKIALIPSYKGEKEMQKMQKLIDMEPARIELATPRSFRTGGVIAKRVLYH